MRRTTRAWATEAEFNAGRDELIAAGWRLIEVRRVKLAPEGDPSLAADELALRTGLGRHHRLHSEPAVLEQVIRAPFHAIDALLGRRNRAFEADFERPD